MAATRPPWTFRPTAPLSEELGAEVLSLASAEELVEDSSSLLVSVEVAVELEESEVLVIVESVAVESVAVESVAVESVAVEVTEPEVADPVVVPVAPWMPKLGEKLMLVGSVSSMISMVYWKVLTSSAAGIVRVAVPSAAVTPAREMT